MVAVMESGQKYMSQNNIHQSNISHPKMTTKETKTMMIVQQSITNLLSEWDSHTTTPKTTTITTTTLQLYQLGCILEYLSSSLTSTTTTSSTSLQTIYQQCGDSYHHYLQQQQQLYQNIIKKQNNNKNNNNTDDRWIRDIFNEYIESLLVLLLRPTYVPSAMSNNHIATTTTTSTTLNDIQMALTSLIQLYNHSDIAYHTCFQSSSSSGNTTSTNQTGKQSPYIETWTIERLTLLIQFLRDLYQNTNKNTPSSSNVVDDDDDDENDGTLLRMEIQHAIYTIVAYCLNVVPPVVVATTTPTTPTTTTTTNHCQRNNADMILSILQLLQNEQDNGYNLWDGFVRYMNEHFPQWREQVLPSSGTHNNSHTNTNEEDETREKYYQDYIQSILSSTITTSSTTILPKIHHLQPKSSQPQQSHLPKRKVMTAEEEILSRIQQVKSILPQYGDGFIELALSCFNGNVETTIATLLLVDMDDPPQTMKQQHWPVVLQNVDIALPRRHVKDSVAQQQLEERQAKEITKASILASQERAELEARMLEYVIPSNDNTNYNDNDEVLTDNNRNAFNNVNEYDDDYDDQYDYDVHYFVDASNQVDTTTYHDDDDQRRSAGDDDYDAIRTYNRTMKEMVSDQEYWNQNRNTNRNTNYNNHKSTTETSDSTDSKQYRGPDLLRGGRVPNHNHNANRGAGRGRGRGGPTTNTAASGRGRGGNMAGVTPPPSTTTTTTTKSTDTNGNNTQPPTTSNLRHKARVLDKRRDQQKKAQMKRTGGM